MIAEPIFGAIANPLDRWFETLVTKHNRPVSGRFMGVILTLLVRPIWHILTQYFWCVYNLCGLIGNLGKYPWHDTRSCPSSSEILDRISWHKDLLLYNACDIFSLMNIVWIVKGALHGLCGVLRDPSAKRSYERDISLRDIILNHYQNHDTRSIQRIESCPEFSSA